jgi:hypothetical protein
MNRAVKRGQISNLFRPPTAKVRVECEITFTFKLFSAFKDLAVWLIRPLFLLLPSQILKSVSCFEIKSP